jgi:hypothetical protein
MFSQSLYNRDKLLAVEEEGPDDVKSRGVPGIFLMEMFKKETFFRPEK